MDQENLIKAISLWSSFTAQMAGLREMQLPHDKLAGPQERSVLPSDLPGLTF